MTWFFASGTAADIILTVIAGEALWLRSRQRWLWVALLCRLMPGALMIIALRSALVGAPWWSVAVPLTLSFPFHLADLRSGPGIQAKK